MVALWGGGGGFVRLWGGMGTGGIFFPGWVRVLVGGEMPCHRGCAQEIRDQGIKHRKGWLKKRGGRTERGVEARKNKNNIRHFPKSFDHTGNQTCYTDGIRGKG
jgi:hypothetical protein